MRVKIEMLNKICTDLETSRKLRVLNIDSEFETGFVWRRALVGRDINKFELVTYYGWFKEDGVSSKDYFSTVSKEYVIPAYTLEQILEMLPKRIVALTDVNLVLHLSVNKEGICFSNDYSDRYGEHTFELDRGSDDNLATASAKLLIKLKEDKII